MERQGRIWSGREGYGMTGKYMIRQGRIWSDMEGYEVIGKDME